MATGTVSLMQDQFVQTEGLNVKSTMAVAAAGAATLSRYAGVITTEALTTAQNATYTLTVTNTTTVATDLIFGSLANGTNTQGTPIITKITPAAGSFVVTIKNMHDAAQALNGTLVFTFVALRA